MSMKEQLNEKRTSICPQCNGSGEGFRDDTRCYHCGGKGGKWLGEYDCPECGLPTIHERGPCQTCREAMQIHDA